MRIAGYFMLLSSALHIVGVALAGFTPEVLILLLPAVFYVVLFAGLVRAMMSFAWLSFFCMLIGSAGALAAMFGGWPIPTWVFGGIFAADLATAILLFGVIWFGSKRAPA